MTTARVDHRDRCVGALARDRVGSQAVRSRRLDLRHLRRVFLPRETDRGCRRRRFGDGGSGLPHEVRVEGHRRPPPRHAARVEDHAGQGLRESEDRLHLGFRSDRRRRSGEGRGDRPRPAQSQDGGDEPSGGGWRVHRHRPHAEYVAVQGSDRSRPDRLHRHPRRHAGRISLESLPPATSRITSIGRRSRQRVPAVWRRSTPSDTSKDFRSATRPRTSSRTPRYETVSAAACVEIGAPGLRQLLFLIDTAYDHVSWHGPNLRGSLRGMTPALAAWRPAPGRHNIWELIVHAAYWKYVAWRRLTGAKKGSFPLAGSNFIARPVDEDDRCVAGRTSTLLDEMHRVLRAAAAAVDRQGARSRIGPARRDEARAADGSRRARPVSRGADSAAQTTDKRIFRRTADATTSNSSWLPPLGGRKQEADHECRPFAAGRIQALQGARRGGDRAGRVTSS